MYDLDDLMFFLAICVFMFITFLVIKDWIFFIPHVGAANRMLQMENHLNYEF